MITVGEKTVYFGDFHGQWNAAEEDLALLVAGLWQEGYDFTAFQTPDRYDALRGIVSTHALPLNVLGGREYMYDWGHLTTVGVEGTPPPIDSQDVASVLAWFKEHGTWVVLAHPYEAMKKRLDDLLDQGLLDAVELVNGHLNSNRNRGLAEWYGARVRAGKATPIVSGLDIHIPKGSRRPNVLYTPAYPPQADIDLFGANRTGVVAAGCDAAAVKAAIAAGRTFIELTPERRLVGPPDLVSALEREGYWDRVEQDLERRRGMAPSVESRIVGGERTVFSSSAERVETGGREQAVGDDGLVRLAVPLAYSRNTQYVNVVSRKGETLAVHALKVHHPLSVELLPDFVDGTCRTLTRIVNAGTRDLDGLRLSLDCGGRVVTESLPPLAPLAMHEVAHDWRVADRHRPTRFTLRVGNDRLEKQFAKHLVFIDCPHLPDPANAADWERIDPIRLSGGCDEQVDRAFTVFWNGEADLSAEIRLGWNAAGLHFRLRIRDDVLAPSKISLLMFGDCLQIGINPIGCEAVGNQSFHDLMMTRGTEPDGKDKVFLERSVNMALEYPSNERVRLDGLYAGSVRDGVFEGTLTLPFDQLAPMQPLAGYRFGLYLVLFDNDGDGLKTALQWPLSAERHVGQAWYVPYGGAWASVRLSPPQT